LLTEYISRLKKFLSHMCILYRKKKICILISVALKRLDDLEGAERSLTKAHALAPQDPLILINYAVVLDVRGKQTNASEILTALNDTMAIVEVDAQVI